MPISSREKRVALLLMGVAAVVWIAQGAYRSLSSRREEPHSGSAPELLVGATLPQGMALEGLGAGKATLSELKGKVVLLNFWAGWCGPCLHEMPGLYKLHRRLAARGLVVLGVNMDDRPEDGLLALKRLAGDAPFPHFRGTGSGLADRFAIDALPFTVLLDRDQKIRYAKAGEVDWGDREALGMIEALL